MGHRGAVSCPWSSASTRSHPLLPGEHRLWPPSTRGAGRAAAESRGAELGCTRERGNQHWAPGHARQGAGLALPRGTAVLCPLSQAPAWGCWPLRSTWDCLLRCWGLGVGRLWEGWGARSPAGSRRCQESGAGAGVGQGPVGFAAPSSFRLLCRCRAGSAWGRSGVWVMLVQQHTPAASPAPSHCSAESSSAPLWDTDMAVPHSEHFWAKVGEPACQCSLAHGAAPGRGTGWGPLETQCGPLALTLVVCSLSRWPQYRPQRSVATAVVRMRPGAGRVPAWQERGRTERQPRARQGEAALLVRVRGAAARPKQGTPERKLRLKALSWERGRAGGDGAGPGPGRAGLASGSSFPVAGLAGGSCACKGSKGW